MEKTAKTQVVDQVSVQGGTSDWSIFKHFATTVKTIQLQEIEL